MTSGTGRFEAGLRRVEDALAAVAGVALLVLTGLMVLGVVLRYVLAEPLSWALAFTTEYLLTAIFFLALPYTFRVGAHVRIDVLYRALPERAQRWCGVIGSVLSVLFVAALTWGGITLTAGAVAGGDIPPPGGAELSWPVWTSVAMVPLGSAVLLVRLLHTLAVRPADQPATAEVTH
jgi:TRAP-type C4-dicarboxylate transport system permease small subunit